MQEKSKLKKVLSLVGLGALLAGFVGVSLFFGPSINYEDKAVSQTFFDKNYVDLEKLDLDYIKYSKMRNLAGDKYTYTTFISRSIGKGITKEKSSEKICSGDQQFIIDIKYKKLRFVEEEVKKNGIKKSYEAAENCLDYIFVNRNTVLQNINLK